MALLLWQKEAVDSTPENHPDRVERLHNLAYILHLRFQQTGTMEDLERGIVVANDIVDLTSKSHPERADRLNHLGNILQTRFKLTGTIDDFECSNRSAQRGDRIYTRESSQSNRISE